VGRAQASGSRGGGVLSLDSSAIPRHLPRTREMRAAHSLPRQQSALLIQTLVVAVALAGWETLSRSGAVSPLFLSSPSQVTARLVQLFASGSVWPHVRVSRPHGGVLHGAGLLVLTDHARQSWHRSGVGRRGSQAGADASDRSWRRRDGRVRGAEWSGSRGVRATTGPALQPEAVGTFVAAVATSSDYAPGAYLVTPGGLSLVA